jgi:predicted nucleic acid-binding protein
VIVADASAVIELLLRTARGVAIADRLLDPEERLAAPHLLDIEVAQVLRRYVLRGELDVVRAEQALDDLSALPIHRHSHEPLISRIWSLRDSVTAYDGAYVALAEALDVPLATLDAKLARSSGHSARIELLG